MPSRAYLRKLKPSDKIHFAKWWRDKDLIALTSGSAQEVTDEDVVEYFNNMLADSSAQHFMITVKGHAIGHIALTKRIRGWYETTIVIGEKEYWGKGYGSAAIRQIEQYAKMKGIRHVYLEVRLSNSRAIRAYKKSGFVEKKRPTYLSHPSFKTLYMAYNTNLKRRYGN